MKLIEKEIITKVGYDNRGLIVRVERTDEEIVRCKDCWVFHQDESWNPKAGLCGWFDMPVGVNDFCSHGEKREDG